MRNQPSFRSWGHFHVCTSGRLHWQTHHTNKSKREGRCAKKYHVCEREGRRTVRKKKQFSERCRWLSVAFLLREKRERGGIWSLTPTKPEQREGRAGEGRGWTLKPHSSLGGGKKRAGRAKSPSGLTRPSSSTSTSSPGPPSGGP